MRRLFILLFSFLIQFSYGQIEDGKYDSIIQVSRALRGSGNYQSAIDNYLFLLHKHGKNSDERAYLLNVLGNTYLGLGHKAEALNYYYEAVELNTKLKNTTNLLKNYLNIASYYEKENQEKRSLKYLLLAEKLSQGSDDYLRGSVLNSLGVYYINEASSDRKNIDTAAFFYIKALQNYKKANNYNRMEEVYNNLANLYALKGQFYFAKENYKKAIHIADSLELQKELVRTYRNLGNTYMGLEQYDSALMVYEKSLGLSSVEKSNKYLIDIHHNLVQANMALGQVEEASILFEKFTALRDSIYDSENVRELKELETKYETNLKDQEIRDQKLAIENENLQKKIFLAITIFLIIMIIAAIGFFNQRQRYLRKLKNEEIANVKKEQELNELNAMMHGQEEERNRIANDLHDRLGARLSSIKLHFQNDTSSNEETELFVKHIDEAIKETREISHNLSTDLLTRFGLKTALKDSLRAIQESGEIKADLAIYGMDKRWPLEIERNVYYILLELMNNTIKHAAAKSIMIQISQVEEEVNVFYEDDGKGFDKELKSGNGLGMRSLQARISAIDGQLTIDTKPEAGFNAVFSFSLNRKSELNHTVTKIS